MQLLDLLFRREERRRVASLVADAARLSLPLAVAQVGERTLGMSLAEGRGYIRARVRLAVEDQAAVLVPAGELKSQLKLRTIVAERALDRVVARLVAEQAKLRFVPQLAVRRAA